MLSLLRVKNFALIDQLELDFSAGLTVLTGETGAGKSILLDAIDVALGGRINQRLIRDGEERALVEVTFQPREAAIAWLQEQEIEPFDDGSMVCGREVVNRKSGLRSRSRVNGVLVNRKAMAQLRELLVEITAQGQTVQLFLSDHQRSLLDSFGGPTVEKQRHQVTHQAQQCEQLRVTLEKRRHSEQARLQRLDQLEYQLQELTAAQLEDPEELDLLTQERDRLSHVVELQNLSYQGYQLLYQSDHDEGKAIADLLGQGEKLLQAMAQYDGQLEGILEMVRNAIVLVGEASYQLNAYGQNLETDPDRLETVGQRLQDLKQLCRKYGPTLEEAIAYRDQLQRELAELTDTGQSLEELEQAYGYHWQALVTACAQLTEKRQQAARKLEKQLIKELKPLAMDKVVFECRLTPITPNATGADQVNFYFSPNPGEKLQPLADIASGGEMSRFLLALKACFSKNMADGMTLIFDEIDAGVSGKVAQAIAEKLHQLGQKQQVLCVTHQPLVAALADAHVRVTKQVITQVPSPESPQNTEALRTIVQVQKLDNHETRQAELAQLTGGHSAQEALSFADSLLTKAAANKQKP